ncbi:BrnT family toxin [Thermodesulfobacteriota bacterium]
MKFEWDNKKSLKNKEKHGIDFDSAKEMWKDDNRVEIQAPYPLEQRCILISKVSKKLWTAVFTYRGDMIRIISVRRSREREKKLYGEKKQS